MGNGYRSKNPLMVKNCVVCGKRFETRYKKKIRCRQRCLPKRGDQIRKRQPKFIVKRDPTGFKGAVAEIRVASLLMTKGWDVFRGLAYHGVCDLIAIKREKVIFIEVRTGRLYKDKVYFPKTVSKRLGKTIKLWFAVYVPEEDRVLFLKGLE
jgi:Holliday junction resolvase-like predicted endonuclease